MKIFEADSPIYRGASSILPFLGINIPATYAGVEQEYLAGRTAAWLGTLLNVSPIYDVTGPDAVALLNSVAVNRDFGALPEGGSKHVLICNEEGLLLADGVVIRTGPESFRSYWLAPVLQYHVEASSLDVQGTYIFDEFFFQVDGPKSLQILERASGADLHDLKFAQNKRVTIAGVDTVVHRLGMSGALAYELHGDASKSQEVYEHLRTILEDEGGLPQGMLSYGIVQHTIAGYPNQGQHFAYAYSRASEGLRDFLEGLPTSLPSNPWGSASESIENYFVTPFDIGWGYLVNFDHDFPGKDALRKIKADPPRTIVTLEWNADDVGDVFASRFRGTDVEPYDDLSVPGGEPKDLAELRLRGDWVLADGERIGITTGRAHAFFERRFVSLAFIAPEYAQKGRELTVLWGDVHRPKKEIRAVVARFPYYNGEFRNETFDTSSIPRLS